MSNILKKLLSAGVRADMAADLKRRVTLVNGIALFFIVIGIPATAICFLWDGIPQVIAYYMLFITLFQFSPLLFNHFGKFLAAALYLIIAGDLATGSAVIMVGSDSNAQFLLALIAGLPFVILDKKMGNWRLALAFFVLPVWIATEVYSYYYPPIVPLKAEIISAISYVYGSLITLWGIFIFYYFHSLSERQLSTIEDQADALLQKNRQLEYFNYVATHDLKAPINNIKALSALLKLQLGDIGEDAQQTLQDIGNSGNIAENTLQNLYEAIHMAKLVEPEEELSFHEILSHAADNLSHSIKEFDVVLKSDFTGLEHIHYGKIALLSIFQNLVGNAIKYHLPGRRPEIEISSQSRDGFAVLRFKDNGRGLDLQREGKRLFELFQRASSDQEGSGIGLYITKHSVESKGGRIEVSSQAGEGSVFSVFLPLSQG